MLQWGMSTRYKLLFHGAVRKDQHPAVVRSRLQKMLKANDAQIEAMFSGKPVTIKKNIDEATADKYLEAFVAAGAKLELVELSPEEIKTEAMAAQAAKVKAADAASSQPDVVENAEQQPDSAEPSDQETTGAAGASVANGAFQLAEPGADLVPAETRAPEPVAEVDTEHLSLASPGTVLGDGSAADAVEPMPVDTSHLQLDQPGVRLGVPEPEPELTPSATDLNFELGEPGETLVEASPAVEPELPDLSHLQLEQLPVEEPEESPA